MKTKKPYIAPNIKVVKMGRENLMDNPQSWRLYDENGNLIGGGSVIEGNPDDDLDSKAANPFSGDWEL